VTLDHLGKTLNSTLAAATQSPDDPAFMRPLLCSLSPERRSSDRSA
jgi:hypothetical protein